METFSQNRGVGELYTQVFSIWHSINKKQIERQQQDKVYKKTKALKVKTWNINDKEGKNLKCKWLEK